jgi:hypothetical protein
MSEPKKNIISYAQGDGLVQIHTRKAVVAAWLLPVFLQLLGWIFLFKPFPGDGIIVYTRNFAAGISGFVLFEFSALGFVPPNNTVRYSIIAVSSWIVLLSVANLPRVRRMPLKVHFAISVAWNLVGLFLYFVMCF